MWQILEARPHPKYYLTPKACQGILRRAAERGKPLPEQLRIALEIQAGVRKSEETIQNVAFHINQRNEGIDLNGVSGALMAPRNMQMQTFVAAGVVTKGNGDCFLTEEKHTALSVGGGQAGQGYPCVLCLNDQGGQFMKYHRHPPGADECPPTADFGGYAQNL